MDSVELNFNNPLSSPERVYIIHLKRIIAFLADHIIISIFMILLGSTLSEKAIILFITDRFIFSIIMLILFFLVETYYLIFELLNQGRTPGKWLLKIRVVDYNLMQPDFCSLLIRNSARCFYLLPPFFFLPDLLCFLVTSGKRIGDIMAKTIVVKK